MTLVSVGPIPRGEVLKVFESALHASNAAIVNDGAIYKVVPISEANGGGPVNVGVESRDTAYQWCRSATCLQRRWLSWQRTSCPDRANYGPTPRAMSL